jgi:5-formyltetrahydrofolate cyclo-ligase
VKEDIRKKARAMRESVASPEEKSERIREHLFSLPEYAKAKTVLLYMSKGHEVITHSMVFMACASKKVALPVTIGTDLKLADMDDDSVLEPGAFGILEPKGGFMDPRKVELAVVPGVAFDRMGGRIGYGRGYYDRLLSKLDCPIVALAYKEQLVDEVPREGHDVDVDYIITEDGVIDCKDP